MNLLRCSDACRATKATARRERLVIVARKLFAEHGFHGTGMAQLAAESGIKVGQIYRDFDDKEAIVAEIVESDLAAFLHETALQSAIEQGDRPAIRGWIRSFVRCEANRDSRSLVPEILAETARNARIAAISHTINRRVKCALLSAIHALAPAPEQAGDRALLADLILTLGTGLMHRRIADPDFQEDAIFERLLRIVDGALDALVGRADPIRDDFNRTEDCAVA